MITKWIFQRKDKSKYLEQINAANIEIIRTLKPYIAEKGLPEKEIIDAIILLIARKYKVNSEEMFSIRIICEELIREIVENVYVSSDRKQEYSRQLKQYLHDLNVQQDRSLLATDIEKELKNIKQAERIDYKKRLTSTLSLMISLLVTVFTMFAFLLGGIFSMVSSIKLDPIIIVTIVPIFTMFMFLIAIYTQRLLEKSKDRRKKCKKDDD